MGAFYKTTECKKLEHRFSLGVCLVCKLALDSVLGMAFYTHLYSPETYTAFAASSRSVAGFPKSQERTVDKLSKGDILLCYLTKVSRWVGAHRVVDGPYIDDTPVFSRTDDRFVVRLGIEPLVWLPVEHGIPMRAPQVWEQLSFTRNLPEGDLRWTGKVRRSLVNLATEDGALLHDLLLKQAANPVEFPYDRDWFEGLLPKEVATPSGQVQVIVPFEFEDDPSTEVEPEPSPAPLRESHRIQGVLAGIGEAMGFQVWLPKNDRTGVSEEWQPRHGTLLNNLPLSYDGATMKTIENIDVIWIKGRSIVRAFEVEHTTAVYSGILRMADLLALQPNMDIKLHLVAPAERKDKVFDEIRRPVFSLLARGPLKNYCTFLSYDSVDELAAMPNLEFTIDAVISKYEETASS